MRMTRFVAWSVVVLSMAVIAPEHGRATETSPMPDPEEPEPDEPGDSDDGDGGDPCAGTGGAPYVTAGGTECACGDGTYASDYGDGVCGGGGDGGGGGGSDGGDSGGGGGGGSSGCTGAGCGGSGGGGGGPLPPDLECIAAGCIPVSVGCECPDDDGPTPVDDFAPPALTPCEKCGAEGDRCGQIADSAAKLCLDRLGAYTRTHCETNKTDYRGERITGYTCRPISKGKQFCYGPGIEQCIEDFATDHPGYTAGNSMGFDLSIPDAFGGKLGGTENVTWGGRTGYRTACYNYGSSIAKQCVELEMGCRVENACYGDVGGLGPSQIGGVP